MNYFKIFKEAVQKFLKDNPMNYGSSIAFYTIFSLPAILMIAITIAGSAFEVEAVKDNLISQIQKLLGTEGASTINKIIDNSNTIGPSLFAKIIGAATLIFSASTVFISLQDGLNHVWGIKAKPSKGWMKFIISRLVSIGLVISLGFLLLVSLILDTTLAIFVEFLTAWLSTGAFYVIAGINIILLIGIMTVLFALIFKTLPDATIKWADVWVGGLVTTLLFTGGKFLLGYYLSTSTLATSYGAAGSLVLLLMWVYYSSAIVLFGAAFTFVYSKHIGHKIIPEKHAVLVEKYEKEKGIVNNDDGV